MFQKFKITFYALIVLLVLVLPSQAVAQKWIGNIGTGYADSCAGQDCAQEGLICRQGTHGANDRSYICRKSKWKKITCEDMRDKQYTEGINIVCRRQVRMML